MLPEISARRSLLEPSFRYLSPGREGEKCRPLDHMWQIPLIHSAQFLIMDNFYIYVTMFQLFPPCGIFKCVLYGTYSIIAHALMWRHSFQSSEPLLMSFFIPYGTCWCIWCDTNWIPMCNLHWYYTFCTAITIFLNCVTLDLHCTQLIRIE